MKRILALSLLLLPLFPCAQQIIPERERASVRDALLADRFENLLPGLMDRTGIDMWILISREYNDDPVLKTMLPATWHGARRRTILLFYRDHKTGGLEKLAVARYNIGDQIISAWEKEKEPDQWKRLVQLIGDRDPARIGLNYSRDHNIADGLVKTDYDAFMAYLPQKYRNRVVSAEELAVAWIETRTPREMVIYKQLVDITHDIIAEAFSEKVISPGITTTTDVEWWFRQKITNLGLETWFHPTVDIQRNEQAMQGHLYSFSDRPGNQTIMPGDLLHCDFGITYLGLNTDCQELAYVLLPGEQGPPGFLINALKDGNRVQDHLTEHMVAGRTGNQILAASLEAARKAGLKPAIYTHPLGSYGHSAGTTIGMWDAQEGVSRDDGDKYPLHPNTVYAIELNTTVAIPEWKREVRIMLEEAGFFGEDGFRFVNGRQTELLTIPRQKPQLGE